MHEILAPYPHLAQLVRAVCDTWPEHIGFLRVRFAEPDERTMELCETISRLVLRFAGDRLDTFCRDYRWMCGLMVEEDLHFRRSGRYRWSLAAEVEERVYGNPEFMRPYLRGLLLSQVMWRNQTDAFRFYIDSFLGRLPAGASLLEIGPGHGLLLYFAETLSNAGPLSGWDISDSSLEMTRESLATLGIDRAIRLEKRNVETISEKDLAFDAIVISELLEHLENPVVTLRSAKRWLRPGGMVYINIPINSPAPDHIFNWPTPTDVHEMVLSADLEIMATAAAPVTGCDLERATKLKRTVNVLIAARAPF